MVQCLENRSKRSFATKDQRRPHPGDEELAAHLNDIGWDCHLCAEHKHLDNEPLLRGEKCDEKCVEHCLEWLKQPAEEGMEAKEDGKKIHPC